MSSRTLLLFFLLSVALAWPRGARLEGHEGTRPFLATGESLTIPAGTGGFYAFDLSVYDAASNRISYTGGPYFAVFDQAAETTGNPFGSAGGELEILEGIVDLGGGVQRYFTQVTALDTLGQPEPLVNEAFAGGPLLSWQYEVGTPYVNNEAIDPGFIFVKLDSGLAVFDSGGQLQGTYALDYDYTFSTVMAAIAIYGLDGADIAGADIATLQMFWDIRPAALPEFDSDPVAGSTLQFDDTAPGESSSPRTITVSNLGDLGLALTCEITGTHANQFSISNCPAAVFGMTSDDVEVVCQPTSTGEKSAVLTLTTYDEDEPTNDYFLSCTGVSADTRFSNGFEGSP